MIQLLNIHDPYTKDGGWVRKGNLYRTLPIILCSYSHVISSLLILFSESHYYLSHVIRLFLRVLGSSGKICPLCPNVNLTADHRGPMFTPSDTGPWRIDNSGSLPLLLMGCLREVGGRSHNYCFCTLVITNHACLACVISMITMHATNSRRTPLLINLG